jgi:DNA-nicking Smr family endonuclease
LRSVHAEGGRCVLVIHGRGRHSEGEPVLKEALLEWLAEPPVASLVMAFASASGGDGGVGATYVLLRSER